MSDVIVIGGGAAGMLAAISAASGGHRVCLLEKNEKAGKKLYITGKGRCNVTNACDFDTFQKHIVSGNRFLYSALRGFSNQDVCALLEAGGCRLKTERGERVFPVSDHASDVTKALLSLLRERGVTLRLHCEVTEIRRCAETVFEECVQTAARGRETDSGETGRPPRFEVLFQETTDEAGKQGRRQRKGSLLADAVIVCTGGLSYPTTGSTGDGYRFAESFGIACRKQTPSLVPLVTEETDFRALQGLSLKNCSVKLWEAGTVRGSGKKKPLFEDFGELLFTHFGLSGPLILSASAHCSGALSEGRRFRLSIDLKPALSEEQLDARMLRDFAETKNMDAVNALGKLLPQALRAVILGRAGIPADKKVHDLTREERKRLVRGMKDFSFTVTGTRGFSEAVVTQGGVSLSEIDPKTMMAKRCPGLYFAGEVLDIDALTGGFNLQLAWSTGFAAGHYIG